jgi:hypothetical protein
MLVDIVLLEAMLLYDLCGKNIFLKCAHECEVSDGMLKVQNDVTDSD